MNVYAYQLYKTGLDPAYTNVYDGYTSVTEYLTFLENFSKTGFITVPLPQRSIKEKNGNTFLVIQMKATDVLITGYNYCCIQYTDDETSAARRVFYFITEVESLNDANSVNGNPSCRLTLKYDAWTNNYLDYIRSSNHVQRVSRGTINHAIAFPSTNTKTVIPYSDLYMLKPNSKSINKLIGNNILWLGIRFATEGVIVKSGDTQVFPAIPSQGYNYIFYVPLTKINATNGFDVIDPLYNRKIQTSFGKQGIGIGSITDSPTVLDAWVTYYGADTTTDSDGNEVLNSGYIYSVTYSDKTYDMVWAPNATYTENISVGVTMNNPPLPSLNGYDELSNIEEGMNIYPIKGKVIKCGSQEIPLAYNGVANYEITIKRENSIVPKLSLTALLGSGNNITLLEHSLNSTSYKVAKIVDSLEVYMLNNGNLIENKRMSAAFSAVTSAAMLGVNVYAGNAIGAIGNAGSLVQAGISGASIDAQIRDADNALDTYSIPPSIGTDDPFIDGVYIVDVEVLSEDVRLPYFYDIHCNGDYIESAYPVSTNYKKCFDYIKTLNCSLPDIPILVHRKEIEDAFNRGIRKFHIDYEYDVPLLNLESEYANPSNDLPHTEG